VSIQFDDAKDDVRAAVDPSAETSDPCGRSAFGTLLYTGTTGPDGALSRRSMELMAMEVWPRGGGVLANPL